MGINCHTAISRDRKTPPELLDLLDEVAQHGTYLQPVCDANLEGPESLLAGMMDVMHHVKDARGQGVDLL